MDWMTVRNSLIVRLKEYRYVLIILAVGFLLMLLPEKKAETTVLPSAAVETIPEKITLEEELEQLLSNLENAGKVQVLLTEAQGERILYQTDSEYSATDRNRQDTVILSGSEEGERGLVQQILPPTYLGAVVLCQGAENATVRLAVIEAVSKATGLSSDKIVVLKLK